MVPVPQPADTLQAEAVCAGPTWPLWELESTRSVPVHPSSPTASMSGAIWSTARAITLSSSHVRAAISLAIWFPSSVVPPMNLVVTADLALTLSWAFSFSLSTLQAVIMS